MDNTLEKSLQYISQYMKVNKDVTKAIHRHCARYNLEPRICAWYADMEDFFSDWCDDCGYTRTEARSIYHGGKGEFQTFPNGNIVRYEI
jgi:hypothetical protein